MFLSPFVKFASTTYDYTASSSRNFTPKRVERPTVVNSNDGTITKEVSLKPRKNGLPGKSNNQNAGIWYSEFPFLHSFAPTISGTGYGRQYWSNKQNPFEV